MLDTDTEYRVICEICREYIHNPKSELVAWSKPRFRQGWAHKNCAFPEQALGQVSELGIEIL